VKADEAAAAVAVVDVQLKILNPLLKSLKLRLDGAWNDDCLSSLWFGDDVVSDDDVTADDDDVSGREVDGTIRPPAPRSSLMYNACNQQHIR